MVADPIDAAPQRPAWRDALEPTRCDTDVVGMDECEHVRSEELVRLVPDDLAHRRAHEDELTGFVEPERDVGGAVHQLAEAILRMTEPLVALTLLAFSHADEQRCERAE